MLTTKVVVRVMDDADTLLGSAVVQAEARGDGCLWAPSQTLIPFEAHGRATVLSFHLADVHIEQRIAIDVEAVPGRALTLAAPLVKLGDPPTHVLPPITVGAQVVALPVGVLGAKT